MNIQFAEMKKTQFSLENSNLIEDGTLRQVYSGNMINIYAVAQTGYAMIPFIEELTRESFLIVPLRSNELHQLMEKEENFIPIIQSKAQEGGVRVLDQNYKQQLQNLNLRKIESGKTALTRELEEQIFGTSTLSK